MIKICASVSECLVEWIFCTLFFKKAVESSASLFLRSVSVKARVHRGILEVVQHMFSRPTPCRTVGVYAATFMFSHFVKIVAIKTRVAAEP